MRGGPAVYGPEFDAHFGWFMRVFAGLEKNLIFLNMKFSGITPRKAAEQFSYARLNDLVERCRKHLDKQQPTADELVQFQRTEDQFMLIAGVRNDLAHYGADFKQTYALVT